MRRLPRPLVLSALAITLAASTLRADEGMWTFDNLPVKQLKERYGFVPDQAWLDHVRLATVIFGGHGTGSFVSRDGLVLTNHHVGHAFIQQVSDRDHDYVENGFVARNRDQEIRVPDLELQLLVETKNVTGEVEKAVKPGMDPVHTRREALEELTRKEHSRTGMLCEPVLLYQGGECWIYVYRRFRDVRLVMAPEHGIANFGKDWDNFAYPRHDMDFSLFRVYENGQPYHPEHHLVWTEKGVENGDMTFIVGHPGRTARLETLAQMEFRHRVLNPLLVKTLEGQQRAFHTYASQGAEQALRVSSDLMGTGNFLKVYRVELQGLGNREAMAEVAEREKELRAKVARDPKLQALAGESWAKLERAFQQEQALAKENQLMHLRFRSLVRGPLEAALTLVRVITESAKPDDQRLEDFGNTQLEAMKAELLSAPPMHRDLEALLLSEGLAEAQSKEFLGPNHPLVKALLGGKRPEEAAKEAISGTRIDDPVYVKVLLDGGLKALTDCEDPLVILARKLDARSREVRRQQRALDAIVAEQNTRIAKARFAVYGKSMYPDATFTLRLSYGSIRTYEAEGTLQQPFTTFGGLFDRADAWGPKAEEGSWALPPRWIERRNTINPSTPLDFITTNDITGGNSGSPVLDRKGDVVGLVFDGDIQSIPGRFYYDEKVNRAISLDARAITEALTKVYDAGFLVEELRTRP